MNYVRKYLPLVLRFPNYYTGATAVEIANKLCHQFMSGRNRHDVRHIWQKFGWHLVRSKQMAARNE